MRCVIRLLNESTVVTVCLLPKLSKAENPVEVEPGMNEPDLTSAEIKSAFEERSPLYDRTIEK